MIRQSFEENEESRSPYVKVAASNGMIAIRDGGGRHPCVTCFVEAKSEAIQPYQKKVQRQVWRSTVCRDNRILEKHWEFTERDGVARADDDSEEYGRVNQRSSRKNRPAKVSERLYKSPEHLVRGSPSRLRNGHFCSKERRISVVSPNYGEDETFELLEIMDDRERSRK